MHFCHITGTSTTVVQGQVLLVNTRTMKHTRTGAATLRKIEVVSLVSLHITPNSRNRTMKSRHLRLSLVMMLSSCSVGTPNGTQQSRYLQQDSGAINSEYYASLQGRLTLMRRCEASVVYVDRIYLTCDSPGDYYYGSGGYRKSSRCKYGDNANMYIFCKFYIVFGIVLRDASMNCDRSCAHC
jgi:hypothetical protein